MFDPSGNIRYAPDIVFDVEKYFPDCGAKLCEFLKEINFCDKEYAVISVISFDRRTKNSDEVSEYYDGIKRIAGFLIDKGLKILFFSFCKYEGDLSAIEDLFKEETIADNASYYSYEGNVQEALNIISKASTVIATRFHAMILGITMKKRVLPIVYDQKIVNVLSDLQWDNLYCDAKRLNKLSLSQLECWYENYNYHDFSNEKRLSQEHFIKLDQFFGRSNLEII